MDYLTYNTRSSGLQTIYHALHCHYSSSDQAGTRRYKHSFDASRLGNVAQASCISERSVRLRANFEKSTLNWKVVCKGVDVSTYKFDYFIKRRGRFSVIAWQTHDDLTSQMDIEGTGCPIEPQLAQYIHGQLLLI